MTTVPVSSPLSTGSRYDAAYPAFAAGDQAFARGLAAFSTPVRIRADSGSIRSANGSGRGGAGWVTAVGRDGDKPTALPAVGLAQAAN